MEKVVSISEMKLLLPGAGEVELDQDNVLIIFDIPKDKQNCWMVEETPLPKNISLSDVLEGGRTGTDLSV